MIDERGSSIVERWYHHIVAGISLAGLLAGITILWNLDRDVAVMQEKIGGFEKQISILTGHTQNRYTAIDAARDRETAAEIHKDQESRLRRLERDHNRVLRNEGHLPNGQLRAE